MGYVEHHLGFDCLVLLSVNFVEEVCLVLTGCIPQEGLLLLVLYPQLTLCLCNVHAEIVKHVTL